LRVFRQTLILLVLDDESVGVKFVLGRRPCVFPIEVVDSSFDDWALRKSNIGLALKQGD